MDLSYFICREERDEEKKRAIIYMLYNFNVLTIYQKFNVFLYHFRKILTTIVNKRKNKLYYDRQIEFLCF